MLSPLYLRSLKVSKLSCVTVPCSSFCTGEYVLLALNWAWPEQNQDTPAARRKLAPKGALSPAGTWWTWHSPAWHRDRMRPARRQCPVALLGLTGPSTRPGDREDHAYGEIVWRSPGYRFSRAKCISIVTPGWKTIQPNLMYFPGLSCNVAASHPLLLPPNSLLNRPLFSPPPPLALSFWSSLRIQNSQEHSSMYSKWDLA